MVKLARIKRAEWDEVTARELEMRQMANKLLPGWNEVQRIKAQISHKVVTKLQMPHGPGETTGTQHHCFELENMSLVTVQAIFAGVPCSPPAFWRNKAGIKHQRNNWEARLHHMERVSNILDLGCSRLAEGKGEGASVMRVSGEALVCVAPPFLVEHVDNGQEICRLTISFNSVVLNSWASITWPPTSLFATQEEYVQMEKFVWMQALEVYEQSHEGMSPSFQRLMANRFSALLQSRSTPEKENPKKSYASEEF